jgi:Fe2+ or Zn2+ uptake regulation protein
MTTRRITSQNRIILDYLKGVKSHPSAEKIYKEVKKKLPRISMGTVYRNLKTLKEMGEIQEIPSKVAHYDADKSLHAHFFCQICGEISDIFEKLNISKPKKSKVGKIKNYQIYFYGLCKKCQKSKLLPRLQKRNKNRKQGNQKRVKAFV